MAFPSGWSTPRKLTIDRTKVGGTLTNFAVYLDETALPEEIFTGAKSDGSDIRFTLDEAGTQPLDREVFFFDKDTQDAHIWVGFPTLSNDADTEFYVWWGNASATEPGVGTTFTAMSAVLHLGDTLSDSSGNGNNGTAVGTVTVENGIVGGASGVSDSSYVKSHTTPSTGSRTYRVWMKSTDGDGYEAFIGDGWKTVVRFQGSGQIHMYVRSNGNWYNVSHTSESLNDGNWHLIHAVVSEQSHIELFVDGVSAGGSAGIGVIDPGPYAQELRWGVNHDANNSGNPQAAIENFNGELDEAAVFTDAIPFGWAITEYNNQSSPGTFVTVEALPLTGTLSEHVGASDVLNDIQPITATLDEHVDASDSLRGGPLVPDEYEIGCQRFLPKSRVRVTITTTSSTCPFSTTPDVNEAKLHSVIDGVGYFGTGEVSYNPKTRQWKVYVIGDNCVAVVVIPGYIWGATKTDQTVAVSVPYTDPDTGESLTCEGTATVTIQIETLDNGIPYGEGVESESLSGSIVTFPGNYCGRDFWIGFPYEFRYRFSPQFLKAASGGGGRVLIHEGRLQIRQMTVVHHATGRFDVEVQPRGKREFRYQYRRGISFLDGTFDFPVLSKNDEVRVDLVNDSPLPCNFLSAAYEAEFAPRSRRVM